MYAYERDWTQRKKKDPVWLAQNRKTAREYWQNLRLQAMDAYGGRVCSCCGETELLFLTLDHINEDGAAHRREIARHSKGNGKGAYPNVLGWMKRNNFPPGFQVLCMNCNVGKHKNKGVCPHQRLKLVVNR